MKNKLSIQLIALFTVIILVSSCGSSVPRNELQNLPSLIEIMGINLTAGDLKIRVSHRNNLTRINNKLNCQLALKDFTPIKISELPLPDLTNYAVETVDIKLSPADLSPANQSSDEIPYVLDCYLFSENFSEEHLIKKSTFFRVPGTEADYR